MTHDDGHFPKHLAIIMDGNGRWAQRRGRERFFGHVRGVGRVREIVRATSDAGIKALTLFAFSTENWSRPAAEIQILWKILERYLRKEVDELDRNRVSLNVIGELDRLPPHLQSLIRESVQRLASNQGLKLNMAISYGSQKEIADAAKRLALDVREGKVDPTAIDEKLFESYLWTACLGDLQPVDLVIRTSGECRLSNFLLWQSAYAEYYFTKTCWPDFGKEELEQALEAFSSRDRRFGRTETAWHPLRMAQKTTAEIRQLQA